MFPPLPEFKIGRPQVFAGLMLLVFLAQCLWAAGSRRFSELEYAYIFRPVIKQGLDPAIVSPLTGWTASLPLQVVRLTRGVTSSAASATLAVPRPWIIRMPFVAFGLWLGGALWWVARRLFGDSGGYVTLGLYCSSPAMIMASSNVGPEIILAWSIFGLIYTAIGVAHTLYAPPRKWAPRIVILGLALGFAASTALWSAVILLPALAFMLYLAPGRRASALLVVLGAVVIGLAILSFFSWTSGTHVTAGWFTPKITPDLLLKQNFVFADDYALVALFIAALTAYGSWRRARYFGNTAPLLTAFGVVLLLALVPSLLLWTPALALCFIFVFIGGVSADLLQTRFYRAVVPILSAGFVLRIVLGLRTLWLYWIGQSTR